MSLQRRVLLYLLLCAPLVWGVALTVSANRARHEVNELFDTELIRLAREVQATLPGVAAAEQAPPEPNQSGDADLSDLAIAVWNAEGRLLLVDREGVQLPRRPQATGFVELTLDGNAWRVYYLQSTRGAGQVAAGQRIYERDEVVWSLVGSQLLPWLLMLPVLLVAMAWAVRRALSPVHTLTQELQGRGADDLRPVPTIHAPSELQPLVGAMNGLFARIDATLARERRFTADAAHELRTPLAVLRAQWDVLRRAADDTERQRAQARLGAGMDRMERLVTQMLALSRVEAHDSLRHTASVDWPAIVEQVMNDVLAVAERRHIDLACDWPAPGTVPFALHGDADLLTVLLRNLLDNAVRYAPVGSTVTLRFEVDGLVVENDGPALPADALAKLGERFRRVDGQAESGSGLGVSIAQSVATLHGLSLRHGAVAEGRGIRAELRSTQVSSLPGP